MGDTPTSQPTGDFSNAPQGSRLGMYQPSSQDPYSENETRVGPSGASSHSPQSNYPSIQGYPSQQQVPQSRTEAFSMNPLGTALPDIGYQGYGNLSPQRYPPGPASPALVYQLQNVPQYAGAPSMSLSSAPYNIQYQNQYQATYASNNSSSAQQPQTGTSPGGQFYHNQAFVGQTQPQISQYIMQHNQYGPQGQIYAGSSSQYGMRASFSGDATLPGQQRSNEYLRGASGTLRAGRTSSIASSTGQSSVVRGPPRKPRQSGHAIWIGNLPPQTDLMSLVIHVCKEAPGLESLFLISKSNCAFANFKDEVTCAAAQQKIHDSKFRTVRLVSRLRRSSVGTVPGVAIPTGPAALTPLAHAVLARTPSPDINTKAQDQEVTTAEGESPEDTAVPKDKFFVVKSLTVEDLELSVRNGIWATQSHNEEALNKAYQTADNVYLIFSANKSGEYFGYARMISPINDDPAAAIEFAPKAQAVEDPELPKAIPTPATEFAPKGRIIDDSARGTIFWEAEQEEGAEEEEENRSNRSDPDEDSAFTSKAWGKPFKVEWISTNRLPFYRTRGLRNPWNSNREVKIARDGTQLETAIGQRLLGLFHRVTEPVTQPLASIHGVPVSLMGYPPMRPF